MTQASDNLGSAQPTVARLIQMASRLEQAWRATPAGCPPPDCSAFLPPTGDALRPSALRELVRLDMELRWKRGEPAVLESYVERFPELGALASLPVELIFHEFRVRRRHGDRAELEDYRQRFPSQYRRLLLLARQNANGALDSAPTPPSEAETSAIDWATCTPSVESGRSGGEIVLPPPPPPPASTDGSTVVSMVGGYRMLQRLGSGALGEVWKAEAPGGVEVAVKRLSRTLDAHEAQYELQSLEHVKRLRHNFLAQIHAYWVNENRLFVVMELADGSLAERAEQARKQGTPGLPRAELLRYTHEAAEALDYLHGEGVHHRDIKPANILLMKGHVKVADFGLARPMDREQSVINATFCGTPAYMAPEVWENKFSAHSDQWSLAVTYVELRLGRRLFKSGTVPLLMSEIRKGQVSLDPLDRAEQQVVRRALHPDPRRRYPTCTAFVQALEEATRPAPVAAAAKRRRLPMVVALLLCLAAGGLVVSVLVPLVRPPSAAAGPARVRLKAPGEVRVDTGREVSFRVAVERENYRAPLRLVPEEKHPHLSIRADSGEDDDFVTVTVHVDASVKPGRQRLHLRTADDDLGGETFVDLTVLYLPPDFEPAGPATLTDDNGVTYYERIRRPLGGAGAVEFVLVPRKQEQWLPPTDVRDPASYYVSIDKITRGQFRVFAGLNPPIARHPKRKADTRWDKNHGGDEEAMPVRDVTVTDADAFAAWLGGRLPSLTQWDKAAGLYHPSRGQAPHWEGSFVGQWRDKPAVAVGGRLLAAGAARDDVSVYGCRDLSGNGEEWTRETLRRGEEVPLPKVLGTLEESVILRGWKFTEEQPLTFEELMAEDRKHDTRTAPYREPSESVGFRVVLEPNG